jgi:hypothetical protein
VCRPSPYLHMCSERSPRASEIKYPKSATIKIQTVVYRKKDLASNYYNLLVFVVQRNHILYIETVVMYGQLAKVICVSFLYF